MEDFNNDMQELKNEIVSVVTEINTFNYISEDVEACKLLYHVCSESRFKKDESTKDSKLINPKFAELFPKYDDFDLIFN